MWVEINQFILLSSYDEYSLFRKPSHYSATKAEIQECKYCLINLFHIILICNPGQQYDKQIPSEPLIPKDVQIIPHPTVIERDIPPALFRHNPLPLSFYHPIPHPSKGLHPPILTLDHNLPFRFKLLMTLLTDDTFFNT